MKTPINIFRKEPKGLVWIAAMESVESASVKIDEVRPTQPGEYFAFNQDTRKEVQLPNSKLR